MTAVDREHAARLVTHLSQQRASGKYCDVCVCVAEQRFLAHKCVLSANSDQLDALILDATDEDNTSHDIEIEIHGVSPVGFEIVLEYFYTGVLRLEPSTVTHTWMTAVYLGLPDIVTRCTGYCQPSGQTITPAAATDVNNNGNAATAQETPATKAEAAPVQLTTTSILSSSTTQPKVSSIVKEKESNSKDQAKGTTKVTEPEPFEIRENQPTNIDPKEDATESTKKKAKLLTTDESAIAWAPFNSHSVSNGQPGVAIPVSSMPQMVVNLVQGYPTYQPVDLNWSNSAPHWATVQLQKGQFVTTGVLPVASQVKPEPVPTPATAVQILNQENSNNGGGASAGESSPISYTTLSLVSQDPPQQNVTRTELETTTPEAPNPESPQESSSAPQNSDTLSTALSVVPITGQRNQSVMPTQELNLDNIHFTQLPTDESQPRAESSPSQFTPATTASFIQPVAILNNLNISNSSGDDTRCDTILMQSQVEQLRIQHQQLQRLQLENENSENVKGDPKSAAALATSKRKRKAPSRVSKSEEGNTIALDLHTHSNVRKSRSVAADSSMVTVTPGHMEFLYKKYPEIKKEPRVSGTCDVMQLLQHGKARQRKSSEQNALNNTIRTILDTTGIIESGDSRVQDAVCLIMDRFTVLQEHVNDPYVRKQLTVKVKHSIHCKKWRLKRHKMKQLETSSSSSPDNHVGWIQDAGIVQPLPNSLINEDGLHS